MLSRRERIAIPSLQQLIKTLAQLIQTGNRGHTQAEIAVSHEAYSIDGYGLGEEVEAWLGHMSDILEVMRCLKEKKVNTGTFFLVESAKNWKKAERKITPTTTIVTRELFKEKFKNNFLSHDFKR